jgi:ABC-type amino acid transport/signal transduction systems, periplasmic component/domain
MFKKNRKVVIILAISLFTSLLVSGCAKNQSTANVNDSNNAGTAKKPQKIMIGIGNDYKPFVYVDENGKPAGYDYEVLNAIDKKLTGYTFEYESMVFDNILVSLDAKKIDLGANEFSETEERKNKYQFGAEDYSTGANYLVVKKGRTDIKTLADLEGKKVQTQSAGGIDTLLLNNFKKSNPKVNFTIDYAYLSDEQRVSDINNGTYDAFLASKYEVDQINEAYGDKLETVGDALDDTKVKFLFRKDVDKEFMKQFDQALKELKTSGKLSEISVEILGGDYSPKAAN